jgi:hypothetical protein
MIFNDKGIDNWPTELFISKPKNVKRENEN